MPLLSTGDTMLFFAHIPKTGGSSVEQYMRRKGDLYLYGARKPPGLTISPQHFHAELYTALLPPPLLEGSFAILRDPMERLLSEYRYRAAQGRGFWRLLDRGVGRRRWVKLGRRRRWMDFDAWVAAALRRYPRQTTLNDNHIRPQSDFVIDGQKLFLFEHGLEPVFRWIDARTGTDPEPEQFHEKRSDPMRVEVSQATQDAVAAFYARDYALIARLRDSA